MNREGGELTDSPTGPRTGKRTWGPTMMEQKLAVDVTEKRFFVIRHCAIRANI